MVAGGGIYVSYNTASDCDTTWSTNLPEYHPTTNWTPQTKPAQYEVSGTRRVDPDDEPEPPQRGPDKCRKPRWLMTVKSGWRCPRRIGRPTKVANRRPLLVYPLMMGGAQREQ